MEQQRSRGLPVLLFDSGDMFLKNPDQMERELPLLDFKGPLTMKSLDIMGYDAANVGWLDLLLPPGTIEGFDALSRFPFIAANVRGKDGGEPFPPFIVKEIDGYRIGIFGLVSSKKPPVMRGTRWAYDVLGHVKVAREVVGELRKSCDVVVALTSLGLEVDMALAGAVPGIDVILGGLSRQVTYQPRMAGETIIVQTGSKGMRMGVLEIEIHPDARGPWVPRTSARPGDSRVFTWAPVQLHKKIADHKEIVGLLDEYKETLKREEVAVRVSPPQTRSVYTGVTPCRDCHAKEVLQWEASRHAAAFATLVKKRQEGNPDCLECHVTGFGIAGGYAPGGQPDLRAVQCEACHGPGHRHRGRGGISLRVPEKVCQGCHTTENSPTFTYEGYLKKLGMHTLKYFHRPKQLR